ncbi:SPX domain-containing protein [Crepidotus variabilis]|uniref:SPX domain-containing protein n=1 Tax=Crepidotus variabilis TaxID=179855 RepID=A0A9P6EM84_9AGAR|nr:SPX domain-containing protein [Crepidotus variabilis]
MKFAQYLQDTQTPEWKRAYIDYRALKKHISVIKKSYKRRSVDSTTWENFPNEIDSRRSSLFEPPSASQISNGHSAVLEDTIPENTTSIQQSTRHLLRPSRFSFTSVRKASFRARLPSFTGRLFRVRDSNGQASNENDRRSFLEGLPLPELLAILPPQEAIFFTMLDAELKKVDAFNLAREGEMLARGHLLQLQFKELHDHKKMILARAPAPWTETLRSTILSTMMSSVGSGNKSTESESGPPDPNDSTLAIMASSSAIGPYTPTTSVASRTSLQDPHNSTKNPNTSETPGSPQLSHSFRESHASSADPESYIHAKRKLKKAVLEHYRGLEALNNYRILNVTGFRKALKKFEKVTKIPVQAKYMTEKVERSSLAFDKAVKAMTEQMEDLYATAFSHGNRKKAMKHLRAGIVSQSHHFSMYRSGLYLGLALPPLIDGLVKGTLYLIYFSSPLTLDVDQYFSKPLMMRYRLGIFYSTSMESFLSLCYSPP